MFTYLLLQQIPSKPKSGVSVHARVKTVVFPKSKYAPRAPKLWDFYLSLGISVSKVEILGIVPSKKKKNIRFLTHIEEQC